MIFIDNEYRCHTTNPDGMFREVETDFFNGKCQTFIEGYRFVPSGESWTREDGAVFRGEMLAPWKPLEELDSQQRVYERELLRQYEQALAEIEVALGVSG